MKQTNCTAGARGLNPSFNLFHSFRSLAIAFALAVPVAGHAATYTKADNTNLLDQATSWAGALPGSGDIANWSGIYSGGPAAAVVTNSLYAGFSASATPSWGGLSVGALTGTCLTQSPIFNNITSLSNITAASEAVVNGFNVVTITCNAGHRFEYGQSVTISGVTPAGYNGTYIVAGVPAATQFTYTNATGGLAAGTAFGTASANLYIGGSGTGNGALTIGGSGISIASGAPGVVINTASSAFNGNQTWNLAPGTVLRFANNGGAASGKLVTSGADGTIEITGGGIASLNEGGATGFSDAAGFTGFSGNWQVDSGTTLRGLRNGATAFGVGSITLNGGTLAVGGMSGDVGNWTWNTTINLNPSTTSYISEQNVTGTGRSLLLTGAIGGSGNLVFTQPLVGATAFTSQDSSFILSGSDTMSGTITIGGPVENGVPGRLTFVRVGGNASGTLTTTGAGPNGSLGTANVVNNGVLSFTLTVGLDVPGQISGTGALRIGSLSASTGTGGLVGDAYQNITLHGVNTYTGPTIINAGTLSLAAGASIANSVSITITTNSVNGGAAINTFDVSALSGGYTVAAGQTLTLNGGAINGTLNLATGGDLTLNGGTINGTLNLDIGSTNVLVPGGSNVVDTLNISGDVNLSGGTNILVLDINNTPANDTLTVGGTLRAAGVTVLQFVPPPTGLSPGTYTLITASTIDPSVTPAKFAIAGLVSNVARPQTFTIVVSGNAVQLVVGGNLGSLLWAGDGVNNVWNTSTTSNWWNLATLVKDAFYAGDQVSLDDTGSNSPAINLSGVLVPGSVTFSNNAKNYSLSGSGQIAGGSLLTVAGTGKVTILTSNAFTGSVLVNGGGILAITNETALNKPTTPTAQSLTLDNGSALLVTNTMALGANTNRGIIIGTGGGTLIVTNGATLTISNVIGDLTGVSVLTKTGNGTLNLNGRNNFGGGSVIDGGSVICGNANALGVNGSSANGTFSPGFTLKAGTVDISGWGNYANTNVGVGTNYLFNGVFITFDGDPGATMNLIDSDPGHPGFGINGTGTINNVITYNGANNPGKAVISAPWYAVGTGASVRTCVVQVDSTTASPVGLEFRGQMSSLAYEGKLAIIQKTGAGVMEISSTNYYPNLQVSDGTLLVNNQYALGADRSPNYPNPYSPTNGVGTGSPHQLIVDGGTVDLNGFSPAIGALSDNSVTSGVILNNNASASLLTLGYSASNQVNSASYAGVIANGTGAVAISKTGTNTQTLAGINTYSGTTTINQGALVVNGQIGLGGAGSMVTVTGGSLGGAGTINAPVTVPAGGTLAPGVGASVTTTLTISSSVTLGGTTLMNLNKDLATNDLVLLTSGTVNYGGVLAVSTNLMAGTSLAVGDSFKLFSAPAHSGNFSGIAGSPGPGLGYNFNPVSGVLSVVAMASNPTNISYSVSGSTLTLSWPADHLGWIAQSNSVSVATNAWYDIAGSQASNSLHVTINPANRAVFYRLRHP
jgi:autotransporter-associated beta strand protein